MLVSPIDEHFAIILITNKQLMYSVLTGTMADATIPLTVAEWEEWGNPNEGR
jgi:hypothetical protein